MSDIVNGDPTKYLYMQSHQNPDRVVTLGYRTVGNVLQVSWAANKCGKRRFYVDNDDAYCIKYDYLEGQHDKFSKSMARTLCNQRLDATDDSHRMEVMRSTRRDPLDDIYDAIIHEPLGTVDKMPMIVQDVVVDYFINREERKRQDRGCTSYDIEWDKAAQIREDHDNARHEVMIMWASIAVGCAIAVAMALLV